MRFDLIDRVLEQQPDSLTALKAVTSAEEYLADHFPSFPVLPGVMMLETLVQAARKLIASQAQAPDCPFVVSEVQNLRYGNMVRPGQTLKVHVTLRKHDDEGFHFQGRGTVNDLIAVQGRFKLIPLPE